MKNKFLIFLVIIVLFTSGIYFLNHNVNFILVVKKYIPDSLFSVGRVIFRNELNTKRLNNDYNVKFLPETQFTNLKTKRIDLSQIIEHSDTGYAEHLLQKKKYSFFLEQNDNKVFIIDTKNNLYFYNKKSKNNFSDIKKINSNLNYSKILDFEVNNNFMYVSGVKKENNCLYLVVLSANLDFDYLNFDEIFLSKKCMTFIQSGKIEIYKKYGEEFLLLATAGDIKKYRGNVDTKPQDPNSIYGKTILINLKNKKNKIFSTGHRNILGLYSKDDLILATENGPRGGDEINKIEINKNYGWNIVSYGETYDREDAILKPDYYKSHKKYGFEEPIFSFVPSIGITEIIEIDDKFSSQWSNNFLIGSLNSRHLFRVLFDENFQKIIYFEKIFIGERIRDLMYIKEDNKILLALEDSATLLILQNLN